MKLVIQLLLWIVILFLGYLVFNSVYDPIQFNEVKEKRYAKVIENLKDIRSAQLAHRQVTGSFEDDFDNLIQFIDTAQFTLTQRRDTVILDQEYLETYGVDNYIESTVVDTLGYQSVKDSLFKGSNRYKRMMVIPLEGVDAEFEMEAGTVNKSGSQIPVFEVKVAKDIILADQDKDLVYQEKQIVGVEEVVGENIRVGSLEEITTKGNWPLKYGDND